MPSEVKLGRLAGLSVSAVPSAFVGMVLLWIVLSAAGVWLLGIPPGKAIVGGLMAVGLHAFSGMMHQLGHAWGATRTGHPMTGYGCGECWARRSTRRTSLPCPPRPILSA